MRSRTMKIAAASVGVALATALTSPTVGQCELQKVYPAFLDQRDGFGGVVAIDGRTMVVGASNYELGGGSDGDGAAFVYEFDGISWTLKAILTSSDLGNDDEFGGTVAIYGSTIVVGASQHGGIGAAYVFEKPATGWTDMTETAKLTPSDGVAGDVFGVVAIDGFTIVVGAQNHNSNQGALYVYELSGQSWTSGTETAKLTASDAVNGDRLGGQGVAIDRHVIVGGADHAGSGGPGAAYIFIRPAGGWVNDTEDAKLTASDGSNGDRFGYAADVRGNLIAVGAFNDDNARGTDSGAGYIFEMPVGGWANMIESAKVVGAEAVAFDQMGLAVAISDDNMVFFGTHAHRFNATTPGAVYRYERDNGIWSQTMRIVSSDGAVGDQFGSGMDVSGDMLVVGANHDDDLGDASGSVYSFNGIDGTMIGCSTPPGIPGDLNVDGVVDRLDLCILKGIIANACLSADVDCNGTVDVTDLLLLLANWGACDE